MGPLLDHFSAFFFLFPFLYLFYFFVVAGLSACAERHSFLFVPVFFLAKTRITSLVPADTTVRRCCGLVAQRGEKKGGWCACPSRRDRTARTAHDLCNRKKKEVSGRCLFPVLGAYTFFNQSRGRRRATVVLAASSGRLAVASTIRAAGASKKPKGKKPKKSGWCLFASAFLPRD